MPWLQSMRSCHFFGIKPKFPRQSPACVLLVRSSSDSKVESTRTLLCIASVTEQADQCTHIYPLYASLTFSLSLSRPFLLGFLTKKKRDSSHRPTPAGSFVYEKRDDRYLTFIDSNAQKLEQFRHFITSNPNWQSTIMMELFNAQASGATHEDRDTHCQGPSWIFYEHYCGRPPQADAASYQIKFYHGHVSL